jgi:hypothetical protein
MCDLPKHREATFLRHAAYPPQKAGRSLQRGGKDRSLAPSFDRAQQKHASQNLPSSTVNTNFSPAHGEAPVEPM